jgi:hypothetical protein
MNDYNRRTFHFIEIMGAGKLVRLERCESRQSLPLIEKETVYD